MIGKNINTIKFLNFIVTLLGLISFYFLFISVDSSSYNETSVFILSWLGIFELIYIILTWKNLTGKYITLYTLFMLFFFLFNYGHPLMWAFGIHSYREIGAISLYYVLPIPSNGEVAQTQLVVLISALMIHFGAMFFKKSKMNVERHDLPTLISNTSQTQQTLYKFALALSPVIIIAQFYNLAVTYINAQQFGYTDLYYNDAISDANVIVLLLARLFLPILIGLLIGSGYNPKVVRFVYIIFGLHIIISLFIGDRGGWIYALLILIVCHHFYYKKIRFKQFAGVALLGIVVAYFSSAVVATRNSGVTIEKLITALTNLEGNPITDNIFVMGASMGVTTVLMMRGWDIFPYGNTFLYGFLISPTNSVIDWLNLNYENLSGWFSQGYLGISNGAGFSIVAEVLINFGPYLLPYLMIIFGILISWITDIEYRNPNTETLRIVFGIITTIVVINISRGIFSHTVGEIIFTLGQFFVYYIIFKTFFVKKYKNAQEIRSEN